jgi:uncharacterized protein (UPF0333 family)
VYNRGVGVDFNNHKLLSFANKKGQTWSFDLIMAVVLFIVIVAIFYAFLSSNNTSSSTNDLQSSAKSVGYYFNCDVSDYSRCFIVGGEVDQKKLNDLIQFIKSSQNSYSSLKKELGVSGDFCVYFRDKNGYLVPIPYNNSGTTVYYSGIGEKSFMLNENLSCGSIVKVSE